MFGEVIAQCADVGLEDIPRVSIHRSGSSFTVDPPVLDTDRDYLLLVDDLEATNDLLICSCQWTNCFKDFLSKEDKDNATAVDNYTVEIEGGARFSAWRKGPVNIIVTADPTLYIRSVAATWLCKAFNVKDKKDRIALFRAVKYGEDFDVRLLH